MFTFSSLRNMSLTFIRLCNNYNILRILIMFYGIIVDKIEI
jgi:hypothetical protein